MTHQIDKAKQIDRESSLRLQRNVTKFMLGEEVVVYSADLRKSWTGSVRKIYGEFDEHGLQVWYVRDGAPCDCAVFSAHDIDHIEAHYSSITLREVK